MKRLNPETGKPFKRGDVRSDGFLFWRYVKSRFVETGHFEEDWRQPSKFDKSKRTTLRYNEKHFDKFKSIKLQWRENNKMYLKNYSSLWSKNNRDKRNATWSKRRAAKLKATPPWLTKEHYIQIESVYAQAKQLTEQTGIPHEVDHIVPLINKLVCGLHVPWNLEVKTLEANRKKSNSFQIHE